MASTRFPLEPLRAALGRPNNLQLARLVGAHRRQVYRWRDDGLSERLADRSACRVGLHPSNIWPEWLS
jgi:hypothetical protein